MVKIDRLTQMTKCAVYEENEGRETLPISRYHRRDYVSLNMFVTFVTSTIAFVLVFGMVAVYLLETGVDFSALDYTKLAVLGVALYAAWEVGFLLITFIRYRRKYFRAKKSLKGYYNELVKLNEMYKGERV